MSEEADREDMNRHLVKMTSDEFARGVNQAFWRANREWYNRDVLFMALIVLWVIGMSIYHFFFAPT